MKNPSQADLEKLWEVCSSFSKEQQITCSETIYQSDRVIGNAYELIEDICDIVGYNPWDGEEDE